jgi:glycosyltransferase involved in cell wall biosynthesis
MGEGPPMHVAQFIHRYPPALGGAESYAARLSRYLVAQGDHVSVWTTTALELPAFSQRGYGEVAAGTTVEDGVSVRRYRPEFRFPGRRILMKAASLLPNATLRAMTQHWSPLSLRMWSDAGRGEKVDVVHALAFPYASMQQCALRFARTCRARFVITPFLHLGDPNDPHDRLRKAYTAPHLVAILREADRVIVQTPTEGRAVEQLGIHRDRIVLQGLGVDPAECTGGNREAARSAWGTRSDEVVIGHLANLSMEKGTPDLVAAVEMARQAGAMIRVVLAGPEMPSFVEFWKWSGPDEWIVRLGAISDEQRRDFFAGIDVFALPSRSDSFGLVFLEAWANALPVVGYRAGGVADVIRHETDGLLLKCGDMDGLAQALRRLADDVEIRGKWGRAGQARLPFEFQWADKFKIVSESLYASS